MNLTTRWSWCMATAVLLTAGCGQAVERKPAGGAVSDLESGPVLVESAQTREEVEWQTSRLRGLKFLKPVNYRMIKRDDLRSFLVKLVEEHYTEQELKDYGRSLAAIGLVPEGTDVMAVLMGLYNEQVSAFYVPEQESLYTFVEQTWSASLDRMLLAHELTHALQDQHFDLKKLPLKLKTNTDRALAASALVEGDATVLMTQWYGAYAEPGGLMDDVWAMLAQNTEAVRAAPAWMREMLLFPYQEGQKFVTALMMTGGNRALNRAYADPPSSTKQILHPERYVKDRHEPVEVEPEEVRMEGWRRIGNDVLGEFGVRSVLKGPAGLFDAQVAALEWAGDRYFVYERGRDGSVGVVWVSVWETEGGARKLASVYESAMAPVNAKRGMQTVVRCAGRRVLVVMSSVEEFVREATRTQVSSAHWGSGVKTSEPTVEPSMKVGGSNAIDGSAVVRQRDGSE